MPNELDARALEAARRGIGTIPGAAYWHDCETIIRLYLAALPEREGLASQVRLIAAVVEGCQFNALRSPSETVAVLRKAADALSAPAERGVEEPDEVAAFIAAVKLLEDAGWNVIYPGAAPTPPAGMVLDEIAAERERQKSVEGWTAEHDDGHVRGELAQAAAAYAYYATDAENGQPSAEAVFPTTWDDDWFKPTVPRRDLIKAAALIVAEIERLDRAAAPGQPAHGDWT